ncbi:MAG: putative lipid II flippase FtsW [Candidatus Babeliaceae bacterium]|nr:putative lipid II flippase FtsW [Candidatus Babeliaceae bacterium]
MNRPKTSITFFLATIICLVIIGLVFIYSSSSVYALETHGSAAFFLNKQLVGLVLGCITVGILLLLPFPAIKAATPYFFLAMIGLTALTLIPGIGTSINGSRRWLSLGLFLFQPSEFLKHATLLYLAYYLEKKRFALSSFWYGYLPFLIILGIPALILLLQPDFGQAVTLVATGLLLFFMANGSLKYLIFTGISGIGAMLALIYAKAYRLRRLLIFLNPWRDPKGAGFQVIQSLIAIGSGKWFGLGIGQSRQKFFYLPMQHTDFIFAIIAEETGFIGVCILVILYLIFLITGMKLARTFSNPFAGLTTTGFVSIITLQALINLFVTTGLAPTKGIGLPFVSYGNSALMGNFFMLGVIVNAFLEDPSYKRSIL